MMKYERLTIRNSDGSVSQPTNSTIEKVFNRLAEIEDDLESGKIIRLPCEVKDTIYYINRNNNVVEEDVVKFFTFTKDGIKPILTRHNKKFWEFYEWDKTVFLAREEAEAKLKELQE
jgi:hypothetical protein